MLIPQVVLDSAASFGKKNRLADTAPTSRPELLVFSANHAEPLKNSTENYAQYLKKNDVSFQDLAYTLSTRRNHMTHRCFSVASRTDPLQFSSTIRSGAPPMMIFVFTGQGAQWAQMGKELFTHYPTYCEDIRAMDRILTKCPHPPSWTIEGM